MFEYICKKEIAVLRAIYQESEEKRLSQINFIHLAFKGQGFTGIIEAWAMSEFDNKIEQAENSRKAHENDLQTFKDTRRHLLEFPDSTAIFLLIDFDQEGELLTFLNLSEASFLNVVDYCLGNQYSAFEQVIS